jgi:transcriptional regulator with XRE-family HTH domain
MVTPNQIGRMLARLRKQNGLSRHALAQAAGCSAEYVRQLEAGRYDVTVGMLQRLAKALGVKVTTLLE